ncbi:MAG: DNA-binding MarR family transcriptional regulator [Bacteroidia bacterium]|jgi:DNA-binding MarR family transcriptional regulator
MEEKSNLFLPEQVCFPLYASSRMITRLYQPLLEEFDLTYPQYLVLLVLWQHKKLSVTELGTKLFLNTNTLTPLIRKMKEKKLLTKQRSSKDERTVYIALTPKGEALQDVAKGVPKALIKSLNMSSEDLESIRAIMWRFLDNIKETKEG